MAKVKTKKALVKRVKVTGSGKIVRMKAGRRHLLSDKSVKRKRRLRKKSLVSSAERKMVKRAIPYAF